MLSGQIVDPLTAFKLFLHYITLLILFATQLVVFIFGYFGAGGITTGGGQVWVVALYVEQTIHCLFNISRYWLVGHALHKFVV